MLTESTQGFSKYLNYKKSGFLIKPAFFCILSFGGAKIMSALDKKKDAE